MAEFSERLKHEIDVLAQIALDDGLGTASIESVCQALKTSYRTKQARQTASNHDNFEEKARVYINDALTEYYSHARLGKTEPSQKTKDFCLAILSYANKTGLYDAASIKKYLISLKMIIPSHFYEAQDAFYILINSYHYRKFRYYSYVKRWNEAKDAIPQIIKIIQESD